LEDTKAETTEMEVTINITIEEVDMVTIETITITAIITEEIEEVIIIEESIKKEIEIEEIEEIEEEVWNRNSKASSTVRVMKVVEDLDLSIENP
jgi:hypothetical protein